MSPARPLLGTLVAVLAVSVAGSVAGCSPDPDADAVAPKPSVTPTTVIPSSGPVELEVAVYGDDTRLRTYRRIADAFSETHPGVDVRLVTYDDGAEAASQALDALELGAGPDVFLADQRYLPALVESGGLEPVDRLLEARGMQFGDDHQRVALTSMSANSRLQCMPAEMSPQIVYLNTRLVPRRQLAAQDVVVPHGVKTSTWTWDDFATTARTVAGLDQLGPIKGVYISPTIENVAAFVRSGDGSVVDDVFSPTSLTLASDDALASISRLATLARDPAVSLTQDDLKERDALDWFTDGDLGMYVGTRDDLPELRAADGLHFDVAPLPSMGRSRSVADVDGYCINAATEQLDAAADFVNFAVGEKGAAIAARSGVMVPARLDTVHEDVFTEPGQEPRNSQFFATSLRRAEPMPYDTAWPRVASMVEGLMHRLFVRTRLDLDAVLEERMVRLDERSESMFEAG